MQPPQRHSLSFCLLTALLFLRYTQITHAYTHRNRQSAQTWTKKCKNLCSLPFFFLSPLSTHTLFLVQCYGNVRFHLRRGPTQPTSPSFPGSEYFNTGREPGCMYDCEPHPAAVHLELLPFQHGSEPTHLFTPEACASGPPPPRLPLFHPSTQETDTSWKKAGGKKKKKCVSIPSD